MKKIILLFIILINCTSCAYYFATGNKNRVSFVYDVKDPNVQKQFITPQLPIVDTISQPKMVYFYCFE